MCEHHKALGVDETAEIPAGQLPEKQLTESQPAELAAAAIEERSEYAKILIGKVDGLTAEIKQLKPMLSEGDLRAIRAELENTIAVINKKEEPVPEKRPRQKRASAEVTKTTTIEAFERNNGNVKATAKELGVTAPTIYNRLRKYGVKPKGSRKKKS